MWRLLLLFVPIGVWWTLSAAGWSREQAFALAILAGTALSWAIEALGGGDGPDLTGYALPIALVASLSMALPVSTPPNAMAYATGELTRRDFLQTTGCIGLAGAVLVFVMFAFVRP